VSQISYGGYRFPPDVIQRAVWLYLRFTLSLRDVEDILAERGIDVTYETIRCWGDRFGPQIAGRIRAAKIQADIEMASRRNVCLGSRLTDVPVARYR
jgi:putative transposase